MQKYTNYIALSLVIVSSMGAEGEQSRLCNALGKLLGCQQRSDVHHEQKIMSLQNALKKEQQKNEAALLDEATRNKNLETENAALKAELLEHKKETPCPTQAYIDELAKEFTNLKTLSVLHEKAHTKKEKAAIASQLHIQENTVVQLLHKMHRDAIEKISDPELKAFARNKVSAITDKKDKTSLSVVAGISFLSGTLTAAFVFFANSYRK